MRTRRSTLALGASAVVLGLSGCVDRIPFLGDEPVEFSAEPASVPESAREDYGYDEHEIAEVAVEETFEAGGQSQEVVVTNWQAEYDKAIDFGEIDITGNDRHRAAICTALTTPQVSVLDRTFNPVDDMSSEELAEMVQDRYEGIDRLEHVGEDSVTIAGEETDVGEFEGEADLVAEGVTVNLSLHIAEAVSSGDDLIIGVGGYPTQLRETERSNIFTMLEAIEHDG